MDNFPSVTARFYNDLRNDIKSGDLLLCSGTTPFSRLIQDATKSPWSHVAFVLRLDIIDRIMVLESVESIGVRTVPLSSYVNDYNGTGQGYPGQLLIARHNAMQQKNIINLSKFATNLLGHSYDTNEIIRIASRISLQAIGLNNSTQDSPPQNTFICSEYAYVCFNSVGVKINYDPKGFIAPADFANCPDVKAISFLTTNQLSGAVSEKELTV